MASLKSQNSYNKDELKNDDIKSVEHQNYDNNGDDINNNNNNSVIDNDKDDKMDMSINNDNIEENSEDILDIIQKNTNMNANININDQEFLNPNDDREMIQDMDIYNDENYSKDIKELKSVYPNIINLYLPNKLEMVKNISNNDIEINNILTSKVFLHIIHFIIYNNRIIIRNIYIIIKL